jgi:transcriptional regulator with XRE-family HTH domain
VNGTTLAVRREALGLNQSEIADLAGLKGKHRRMTVYHWEIGKRNISAALSRLLDQELSRLESLGPDQLEAEREKLREASGRRVWRHNGPHSRTAKA